MFLILLKLEILKLRRSLPLLLMFACPLLVVLLTTGIAFKSNASFMAHPDFWKRFWLGNLALWSYFMLPLYIALITALLNGNEHRNQAWRLLLTLPITRRELYLTKAALAWGCAIGANLALGMFVALAAGLILLLTPTSGDPFAFPFLLALAKTALTCLPVVLIQYAISWRVPNIVFPLAVGICATMGIAQLGNSDYWVYYPWSYSLMSSNAGSEATQQLALLLAAAVGAALLALTTYRAGKGETAV